MGGVSPGLTQSCLGLLLGQLLDLARAIEVGALYLCRGLAGELHGPDRGELPRATPLDRKLIQTAVRVHTQRWEVSICGIFSLMTC